MVNEVLTRAEEGPIIVVAAALTDSAGSVLMQRRPLHKQHGGLWEFPGGKVEPGESPEQALVRELYEELGIAVAIDAFALIGTSQVPGVTLSLYRCHRWSSAIEAREAVELAWTAPDDLATLAMPPADLPLIPLLRVSSRS